MNSGYVIQINNYFEIFFWDISYGTIIHINVFVVYLLMQELLFDKKYFLGFLSIGYNAAL